MKKIFCLLLLLCFSFSYAFSHEFGKWVNVQEGLPQVDKETVFLVYTEKADPRMMSPQINNYRLALDAFYPELQVFHSDHVNSQKGVLYLKVTHWMALPEFPSD